MSLLQYLSRRLLLSALLVSSGIFYIIYILYQWGLDDSTEYYLQQDMLWAKEILENTQELPKNSQFKKFYLLSESNSIIPKEYQVFLQSGSSQENTSEYFFLQDDEMYHYGMVQQINNDEQLITVHQFLIDDKAEGMTLLEVSALASMLLISMMLLDAWLIYRRIARSMQNLSLAAKNVSDPFEGKREDFIEINDIIDSLLAALSAVEDKRKKERLFIQTLSHELRTPMATVQVALELLAKKDVSDNVREKLTVILNSNQQMQSLSNDLLSLWTENSDFKHSDSANNNEYLYLEDELINVIDELDKAFRCKQRFFIHPQQTSQRTMILTSKVYLRLLFNNLCKNAIVHSKRQIDITFQENKIVIKNDKDHRDIDPLVAGAGIGLMIATRASELVGWDLKLVESDLNYELQILLKN